MTQSESKTMTTYLEPELVENLQARLSRIEGHVRGVKRMLQEQEDCNDILIQLTAVKAALNQVTIKLLEGHMRTCVTACALSGDMQALEHLNRALALALKGS